MNRRYFFFLFLAMSILPQDASSQQLVQEGNQWNIYYPPTFSPSYTTNVLGIMNDTFLVNQNVDQRYYKLGRKFSTGQTDFVFQNVYIREDSTKKVFLKYNNQNEFLLYDFDLEVGESLAFYYCNMMVVGIDSIALNNGEMRKRLEIQTEFYGDYSTYWIEGIGSVMSMDEHHFNFCAFDSPAELLCFYENGELLYPESPSSCFLTDTKNLNAEVSINIYPLPFDHSLTIELDEIAFDQYMIYDIAGKKFAEGEITKQITELLLPGLTEGIYYIHLVDESGRSYSKQIIRQ